MPPSRLEYGLFAVAVLIPSLPSSPPFLALAVCRVCQGAPGRVAGPAGRSRDGPGHRAAAGLLVLHCGPAQRHQAARRALVSRLPSRQGACAAPAQVHPHNSFLSYAIGHAPHYLSSALFLLPSPSSPSFLPQNRMPPPLALQVCGAQRQGPQHCLRLQALLCRCAWGGGARAGRGVV